MHLSKRVSGLGEGRYVIKYTLLQHDQKKKNLYKTCWAGLFGLFFSVDQQQIPGSRSTII